MYSIKKVGYYENKDYTDGNYKQYEIKKMLLKFAIRFMAVLLAVLILAAIIIHFSFSSKLTTDLWIIIVPIILAAPILTSVVLATDDELSGLR